MHQVFEIAPSQASSSSTVLCFLIPVGSLAVIGPTRIDYEHTITAVSYIARLFDKILNESE